VVPTPVKQIQDGGRPPSLKIENRPYLWKGLTDLRKFAIRPRRRCAGIAGVLSPLSPVHTSNNVEATFDIVAFDNVASTLLLVWTGLYAVYVGRHLTLAASSGKRNVTIWRPTVCLSVCMYVCPIVILTVNHTACDTASVHFDPTIRRADILAFFLTGRIAGKLLVLHLHSGRYFDFRHTLYRLR